MRALWGRMKMPPWLKILSTGAEVAGTQYMELTYGWTGHCRGWSWQWHLTTTMPAPGTTAAYNAEVATAQWLWVSPFGYHWLLKLNNVIKYINGQVVCRSWKYPRPTLQKQDLGSQDQDQHLGSQDRDQDQDSGSQDQDQDSGSQDRDQDRRNLVSSALKTKTAVSRTTNLKSGCG